MGNNELNSLMFFILWKIGQKCPINSFQFCLSIEKEFFIIHLKNILHLCNFNPLSNTKESTFFSYSSERWMQQTNSIFMVMARLASVNFTFFSPQNELLLSLSCHTNRWRVSKQSSQNFLNYSKIFHILWVVRINIWELQIFAQAILNKQLELKDWIL